MNGPAVGSVARAIALLDAVAESDGGARVNELARRIGVNPSTASRLLSTLEAGGLVERTPGGPYRLGLKLVALSDRVLAQLDVRERARPWLTWLVQETGETATLSVPAADRRSPSTSCPRPRAWSAWRGSGAPSVAHATAAGKVMLAFGSRPRASPDGGADRVHRADDHRPGRAGARSSSGSATPGMAEAVGEREPDLNALAAPVIGRGGELVAILGLQGPRRGCRRRRAARCAIRCCGRPASSASRSGGPG